MFFISPKHRALAQSLLQAKQGLSAVALAEQTGISQRAVYYRLAELNEWLAKQNCPPLLNQRKQGFVPQEEQRRCLAAFLDLHSGVAAFVLNPEQRQQLILCSLLGAGKQHLAQSFCELCATSRSTFFSDLKAVELLLTRHQLLLTNSRNWGYQVQGSRLVKRSLFLHALDCLLESMLPLELLIEQLCPGKEELIAAYYQRFTAVAEQLKLHFVGNILHCLAFLLCLEKSAPSPLEIAASDQEQIRATAEYAAVREQLPELPAEELLFCAMYYLASRIQQPRAEEPAPNIYKLARELVFSFEKMAFIFFDEAEELAAQVARHLSSSYYRLRYGVQIGNPLLKRVKLNYPELFTLCKRSCRCLEAYYGMPVSEDEIAYITLYFGGSIQKSSRAANVRVLLICPNGLASAQMLKAEVEAIHPAIKVIAVIAAAQIESYKALADLVISSIDLDCDLPFIKVQVILSRADELNILNFALGGLLEQNKSVLHLDAIMQSLAPLLHPEQVELVEHTLRRNFFRSEVPEERGAGRSMKHLWDILTASEIVLQDNCPDWRTALRVAAQPLLQRASIEEAYLSEIEQQIAVHGPYMNIAPGFILGHAESSGHVRDLGLSLLRLKETVDFCDRPLHSVMILATRDRNSHLGVMKDLLDLLQNEELYARFCQAQDAAAILACLGALRPPKT